MNQSVAPICEAAIHQHYVGGASLPPSTGAYLDERDPRSREVSYQIARGDAQDVEIAVRSAQAAFSPWRDRRPIERGRILTEIARLLRDRSPEICEVEMRETGRPLWYAKAEVETAAQYFEFYAGLVNLPGGDVIDLGANYHSYTRHEPFGVVAVILPWNAPMSQAARGIAPALAAGNVVVAKPSEFTSVTLLMIAQLACESAGLPAGVLNVVTGLGPEVGAALARHQDVRKIAFTGSLRAGRELGHIAAERVIPVGLELGGKSPHIVFADADLEAAADSAIKAFTLNAGQVCSAGSRILVESSVLSRFEALLQARMKALRVGSGEADAVGPIITEAQYRQVNDHVARAKAEGAEVFSAGEVSDPKAFDTGFYVRPVLLSKLSPEASALRQEIFGPVACLVAFSDEEDAIAQANDTEYGLVAGIWTNNLRRAHRLAARIEAGQIFVNEYFAGGVETPFGGYKQSGIGREKGLEAIAHYQQTKCVTLKL